MTAPELIRRLELARERTRRLVAAEALAALVLAVVAAALALIALDWFIHMPAFLRATATGAVIWVAAAWTWRRIVIPLRQRVSLQEVALRVDRGHPELGDRLATSIERIDSPKDPDNVLWRRVVEQALLAADHVPWKSLTDARRAKGFGGMAALAMLAFFALWQIWPDAITIGLKRFGWPIGSAQWPRQVQIEVLSRDQVIAAGESAEVRMRILRGATDNLRAWVVWREGTQPPRRELMSAGDDGVFWQTNASVRADTAYWFEAGDDSTADRAGHIRVVQRPAVTTAAIRLKPPEYASVLGESAHSLLDGRATALAGSRATVEIGVTKPIGRDATGQALILLRDEAGREYRFAPADESSRVWRTEFNVDQALSLGLRLTDAEALELRTTPQYRIAVRTDSPPSVSITRPTHMLEVTAGAEVDVGISAQDDIDVTSVSLRARIADGSEYPVRSVWSGSARGGEGGDVATSRGADEASMPARINLSPRWPLAEYKLAPGTILEYWAEATDGFVLNGEHHAPAASAVMRLRVLSQAEFGERMREESQTLVQRLRQLATDQDALRRDTASARSGPAATQPDVPASLLRRQRALNASAAEVVAQYKALSDRMRQNRLEDRAAGREADATADELRGVQQGPMTQAASALARANRGADGVSADSTKRESGVPEAADEAALLREAAQSQASAAAALRRMLGGLEKAGDFDGVVRKTRDLLDRQEELTRGSAAAAQETAGIDAKSLSPAQSTRLSDIANRQEGLANEFTDMLARVERLARELSQQDRAAADALARAREAVERESVVQHMREATEAIRQNHGNRSAEAQGAAERGLRSMLSALSERSDRKLAELSKQLADLAERLDRLIRAQEDLVARTQSAGQQADAATAVPVLSTRQSTLRRTSGQVAEQIRASPRGPAHGQGADPASLVDQAGGRMDEAAAKLTAAESGDAVGKQVAAVDLLQQAAESLSAAQEAADREMAARALEVIKQALGEIRAAQLAIVEKTEPIRQRHSKEKRLSRPDGLSLNKLATEQSALTERLKAAREKMTNAVVYDYVTGKALDAMAEAAGHLKAHRTEEAVASERAAAEALGRLLDALDLPPPKESKFAEEDSGAGGGGSMGGGQKERPVPPLAELKLLRSLQAELNAAVKQFDAKVPPPDARTETELHQAEALGKRQQEIRDLATKLIGK